MFSQKELCDACQSVDKRSQQIPNFLSRLSKINGIKAVAVIIERGELRSVPVYLFEVYTSQEISSINEGVIEAAYGLRQELPFSISIQVFNGCDLVQLKDQIEERCRKGDNVNQQSLFSFQVFE